MKKRKLNFGCGGKIFKKSEGWINVDLKKEKGVDKSFNFEEFPYPFEKNTFDYILADNVLEHLDNIPKVMSELYRICKPNAIIEIRVPYYNHSGAYNDATHKHYFNVQTIKVLCGFSDSIQWRNKNEFEILEIKRIPGRIKGKIPYFILNFLDKFLHGMFIKINAKIRVKKDMK